MPNTVFIEVMPAYSKMSYVTAWPRSGKQLQNKFWNFRTVVCLGF
jgi:hypothetical protein